MTRDATSTGTSPFFISYGYYPEIGNNITNVEETLTLRNSVKIVYNIIAKLRSVVEFI
jgi:hypothetical protein